MSEESENVSGKLSPKDAILAILFAPDGKKDNGEWRWATPIEGRTRLVKELFLFSRETKSGSGGVLSFEFTPGPYGPSSLELTDGLTTLQGAGKVSKEPLASGRGERLRLTPAGGKDAQPIWKGLPGPVRTDLFRTKARIGEMTYRQMMVYVYRTYPDFTTGSLIRDEILADEGE
jgi:hypothetical protein